MKLKNWIKYLDSLDNVIIWGMDDKEPIFEGCVFEIPWTIVNYKIGRMNQKDGDEPIFVTRMDDSGQPKIIINVIEK